MRNLSIITVGLLSLFIMACPTPFGYYPNEEDRVSENETGESSPPGSVSVPFFMTRTLGSSGSYSAISASSGSVVNFAEDQEVIIQSETVDANFYYTNTTSVSSVPSDPNPQSGSTLLFSNPLELSGSGAELYIKAIGVKSLMYPSSIGYVRITRNTDQASDPTFSLSGGTYYGAISFSMTSSTSGSQLWYEMTSGGSTPSDPVPGTSTQFSGAISLSTPGTYTFRVIASASGYNDSNIVQVQYVINGISTVFAGWDHTMVLMDDGTLWVTGENSSGELGLGDTVDRTAPVQVMSGVTAASAGIAHLVFLKSDGTLWASGDNTYGQLGDGTTTNSTVPVQVLDASGSPITNVLAVSAGYYRTTYISLVAGARTLWSVGRNNYGQLGDGTTLESHSPVQVRHATGAPMTNVAEVAAGALHTLVLLNDGNVWAFGYNAFGALGTGNTTSSSIPVPVQDASGNQVGNVAAIATGSLHNMMLKNDGSLWLNGGNNWGQLGDGTTTSWLTASQTLTGIAGITSLSSGSYHTMVVMNDGTLRGVGFNTNGQIGNGTNTNQSSYIAVNSNVAAVSAGIYHTMILKNDGTLWASGAGYSGQLGNGGTSAQNIPVQVTIP